MRSTHSPLLVLPRGAGDDPLGFATDVAAAPGMEAG
jgi:hypothetical protein